MTDQPRPDGAQADPASALTTLEGLAAHLAAAFDSGDAAHLLEALAVAARADATTHLAAAAGIPQAALRHAFATGELSMSMLLAVMKVIDLHMPGQAH